MREDGCNIRFTITVRVTVLVPCRDLSVGHTNLTLKPAVSDHPPHAGGLDLIDRLLWLRLVFLSAHPFVNT